MNFKAVSFGRLFGVEENIDTEWSCSEDTERTRYGKS